MSHATERPHYLYIFQFLEWCKVGITGTRVEWRASDIQTPVPVHIYRTYSIKDKKTARLAETFAHATLDSLRSSGEWFKIDPLDALLLIENRLYKHFKCVNGIWCNESRSSPAPFSRYSPAHFSHSV